MVQREQTDKKEESYTFQSLLKSHKLSLSFIVIIALFIICGTITIRGLFILGGFTRTIYEHPLVVSNASLTAALNITKMHRSMKDVVLANTSEELQLALKKVGENEEVVYQQLGIIKEKILGVEGQQLEDHTRQLFDEWRAIRQEVVALMVQGKTGRAISITKKKGADHVQKLEVKMLELSSYARKKADFFTSQANKSQSRLEQVTIILTTLGVAFSVIIAILTTHSVFKADQRLRNEKLKLEKALEEINTLRGIIPICSICKQIRDDAGLWKQVEEYIRTHSEAEFSHSICPECMVEHYPQYSRSPSRSQNFKPDAA